VPHRFLSHSLVLAALTLFVAGTVGQPLAFGQRYGSDLPPELSVVEHGVAGIDAFAKAGGRFTGQKNAWGQTAAMLAAGKNAAVMEAFVRAGGTFGDDKDKEGLTAAMYAVNCSLGRLGANHHDESIEAIAAFGRLGGKFTEEQDNRGETAAAHVISGCPVDAIAVFVKAGGHFDNQPTRGYTAGMFAAQHGVEAIHAFVAAGGKFDSQQPNGQTARDIAARAGQEVLKAYEDAVRQQGGLIYMSSDDEFSALKNPEAIESFVKAGGKFDYQTDKIGWTVGMRAVQRGPDVLKAFAAYGGKFTTQQDPHGETAETIARTAGYGPELLAAYNDAVQKQGGLITLPPKDEYEAARIGPAAVAIFAKAGGKFTDKPDQNDMTSAMIAASSGPETITAYAKAGGHFSDWQNKDGYTAAMVAVIRGADAINAFARAGGQFTDQQDHGGRTAAMWAASRGDSPRLALHFPVWTLSTTVNEAPQAIEAFSVAGGHFTDQQDNHGRTAAMIAIDSGPAAIAAFAKAGGHFTEQEDKDGLTAEVYAVSRDPARIKAFIAAGGHFTDHQSASGWSSEKMAARGGPEQITAFSLAGGVFTDRRDNDGWTSQMLATNMAEYMTQGIAKEGKVPLTDALRAALKKQYSDRDAAAAKAYGEAILRQGGLRHIP
jgi:ankyrin repeat protein